MFFVVSCLVQILVRESSLPTTESRHEPLLELAEPVGVPMRATYTPTAGVSPRAESRPGFVRTGITV
jgi:hypothetical protein